MGIKKLNLGVKKGLKKEIERESNGGRDTRFLNYFDLKDGEKMKIMFLPDANGNFWAKFHKHGPNLRVPGLEGISCPYKSQRQTCPACQKGFELLNESKEAGGESTGRGKALKEEAKKWFAKDYTMVQVLVLESPCEIAQSDDGNEVKLMYLPFAVEKIIKNTLTEGILEEDEICQTPFYIKKTMNQGGQASYSDSYFDLRHEITEDDLAYFDDLKVEQYDYDNLDVIPGDVSTEEVEAWLVKAEEAVAKKNESNDGNKGGGNTRDRVSDRLGRSKVKEEETQPAEDAEDAEEGNQEPEEEKSESTASRGASLRDRLNRKR